MIVYSRRVVPRVEPARAATDAIPADPMPSRLAVEGLTKRFGPLSVLRGLDLRIAAGEVVCLLGENGTGKSTVVGCLARTVAHEDGTLTLDGTPLPTTPAEVRRAGVEVVWQDFGLCPDLDVVANLFLGSERRRSSGRRGLLSERAMRADALAVLGRLGLDDLPLSRPVRTLSRGQQQAVAIARPLLGNPRLLVLDEPTTALGVAGVEGLMRLVRELRDAGVAILLTSHDLDLVLELADRIVILRDGRAVADVAPHEVHRDDLLALMSGLRPDSAARRDLDRLRSLVDQLSEVEPAASLPLIVSSMASAIDQQMLCVHLLERTAAGESVLRRSAAVGMPDALLAVNGRLPVGPGGGSVGVAAETGRTVVVEDTETHPSWEAFRREAEAGGIRSAWAAPIVGSRGVLGTVSGYATAPGSLEPERVELVALYAGYAAAAIEQQRLVEELGHRNRVLEALRGMLETLAGPERVHGGLSVALLALCRGLGASAVAVHAVDGDAVTRRAAIDVTDGRLDQATDARLAAAAADVLGGAGDGSASRLWDGAAGARLRLPDSDGALVAVWAPTGEGPGGGTGLGAGTDALALLDDAARSLSLALEADELESTRREAAALRRSSELHRDLLHQVSHELRTPLTAVHGYASTLLQDDLTWDPPSTHAFLQSIARESKRMERLVSDLLDSSAISSGLLQLHADWCDPGLVAEAAMACLPDRDRMRLVVEPGVEPIWADHDRLEQVVVNLLDNGLRHGRGTVEVEIAAPRDRVLEIRVLDEGPGPPPELGDRIFEARIRGDGDRPGAGLGLAIARGVADAHGGTLASEPRDGRSCFVLRLPTEPEGEGHGRAV